MASSLMSQSPTTPRTMRLASMEDAGNAFNSPTQLTSPSSMRAKFQSSPSLGMTKEEKEKAATAADLKHVPCRFAKVGACTAGSSCLFSHNLGEPGQTKPVCQYFLKGQGCKFGHKCALAHLLEGEPPNMDRQNKKAAKEAAARGKAAAIGQPLQEVQDTMDKSAGVNISGITINSVSSSSNININKSGGNANSSSQAQSGSYTQPSFSSSSGLSSSFAAAVMSSMNSKQTNPEQTSDKVNNVTQQLSPSQRNANDAAHGHSMRFALSPDGPWSNSNNLSKSPSSKSNLFNQHRSSLSADRSILMSSSPSSNNGINSAFSRAPNGPPSDKASQLSQGFKNSLSRENSSPGNLSIFGSSNPSAGFAASRMNAQYSIMPLGISAAGSVPVPIRKPSEATSPGGGQYGLSPPNYPPSGSQGGIFSSSPFSAPGSRSVFLSYSPAERAFPVSASYAPYSSSGLHEPRPRPTFGEDDETDDDRGEELIPSSLNELLSPNERQRRLSRQSGGQRPEFSTSPRLQSHQPNLASIWDQTPKSAQFSNPSHLTPDVHQSNGLHPFNMLRAQSSSGAPVSQSYLNPFPDDRNQQAVSPSIRAIREHNPGTSLPPGLAAGLSRLHLHPPSPSSTWTSSIYGRSDAERDSDAPEDLYHSDAHKDNEKESAEDDDTQFAMD